jgi:hypothetical protein
MGMSWATVLLLVALLLVPGGSAQAASIGDLVFYDVDGDGNYEPGDGETGVSAVTIRLYDRGADGTAYNGDDNLISTTTSDNSGAYLFSGLATGTYYVIFTAPTGRIFTITGGDSVADHDGRTATITLATAGELDDTVDCGLVLPASIGDFVFIDDDGDGIQDSGETGLADVTVRLIDPVNTTVGDGDDVQMDVTTTDDDGKYTFTNVLHDFYYVQVDLPTGYHFTAQSQGSDTTVDSDVDTGTGRTARFEVTVGEDDTERDAGLYEYAGVSGRVFHDEDGDGLQDNSEGDITGNATVKLYRVADDGTPTQVGGDQSTSGTYSFTNLVPGRYYVSFTPPGASNLSLTQRDRGSDDTVDSDAEPSTGKTNPFWVASGEDAENVDAGMAVFSTIGDLVFGDTDEDGVQDGGETGVANALVLVYYPGANGTAGDADDELISNTTTDNSGAYSLSVVAGDYYLRFVTPVGYALTLQDQGGDDGLDSDANADTGRTAIFTVASHATDNTRDAGLVPDADNDGTPDSADDCPNDPGKTAPGDCGCGTPDIDTDGDGVLDCDDNCPYIENADQTDSDGDGIGDVCEDTGGADGGDDDADGTSGLPQDDADGTTDSTGGDDADGGVTLPISCGACGPLGMSTYGVTVIGFGAFLTLRRRRP